MTLKIARRRCARVSGCLLTLRLAVPAAVPAAPMHLRLERRVQKPGRKASASKSKGNLFLGHVIGNLRARNLPLLVLGHSIGTQDQHLVDAINLLL
jgi:hypothetical protein